MVEFKFPLNARVALKSDMDDLYMFAVAGCEGIIRDRRVDDDGFPLVLVEWDKDHWRFNGQPDGWTFESHFQMIDGPRESEKKDGEYLESLAKSKPPEGNLDMRKPPDDPEKFLEDLHDAMDAAAESDGYLIISIKRVPNPSNDKEVVFVPSFHSQALTEEAGIMLDVQLAQLSSSLYQEVATRLMELIVQDKDDL